MFIRRIKLRNLLSFGPEGQELELKPLNVLIGPNGAGKSNLVEVMGLLRSVPGKLIDTISEGGGMQEWVWRGEPQATSAELEIVVAGPDGCGPLRYRLAIATDTNNAFRVAEESLQDERANGRRTYLRSDGIDALVGPLQHKPFSRRQSVLAQFKMPDAPELAYMTDQLARIALFREWHFGRNHATRLTQQPDLPNDFLSEDGENLGLVLNQLMSEYEARDHVIEALKTLYEGVTDYRVDIQKGEVRLFLLEGDVAIPATRLSDGTLRYLCLLTILCHPNPPPLICLEEPELGLHPDILPNLAESLRSASERCQLIVTTHSDVIVDALTDAPESVVVCEKHDAATTMKRLDADKLSHWLASYRLGELWSSGELGGNRW